MKEKNKDIVVSGQQETVLFQDACQIIEQAQESAYRQVNETLIKRNWLLGLRIQHEVLKDKRAEYGEQVVKNLSKSLTEKYGRGFKKSNLYLFIAFYQEHPNFFQSVTGKLEEQDIYSILKPVRPLKLEWTHYYLYAYQGGTASRD